MSFKEKETVNSNTDAVASGRYKATLSDKTLIISEIDDPNYTLERFIQNSVKLIDICGEPTWALKVLGSLKDRNTYQNFKEKKGRIRVITDINENNISNCKVFMTFGEIRHINEIKGNFCINDSGESLVSIISREPESDLKLVYSNSVAIQQQQHLLFNSIWNIAKPLDQKIREIEEEDSGSIITTIIDNPQDIIKRAKMVTESSNWLSVCSTAEWIDTLNQDIGKSFMHVLEKKKKGKHKGIRWLCPIHIKDMETIQFFLNEGIQFRHLDDIPVNFSVTDKYFNFTIEGLEDNNIEYVDHQPKVLVSNDKVYVNHFSVLFESLWKTGTDPYVRLRELELAKSGQKEQKTELIRNSEEFTKRILQMIEKSRQEVLLILASSDALNESLNQQTFEAFKRLVKEKSIRVRILLSTPLSHLSESQLDKEQEQKEAKYISKIKNYVYDSVSRVQFDLIDKKHNEGEIEGMSIIIVDRTEVLCWELNKLYYKCSESTRLAIYSNSSPLVLSYSSIFENLWSGLQLYNDLRKANIRISNSEKRYKEFIDITAHELRTPIQAIMGYSEMGLEAKDEEISNNSSSSGTRYLKLFEDILKNAYRLNRLLEDFLSVTRIENNLLILEKENINIYRLVKDIVDDAQEARNTIDHLEEKIKNISIYLEEQHFEADPIVNVDKMKIYQVLTNLINNALRFSESNQGITLSMKIIENEPPNEKEGPFIDFNNTGFDKNSIGYLVHKHDDDEEETPSKITKSLIKKANSSIVIRVKDKGKGIDKKILPNLFEKFVTDSRYGSGTGLGLYISKRIIEIHGGKIWAENNRDEPGATFSFSLPLVN